MIGGFKSLDREFYLQNTLEVAKQLLGKALVFNDRVAIITETEAYCGLDDPASHAAKGMTKRNEAMFYEGGYSYVYFIYGMHYCLNLVTEEKDFPAAVLIRAAYLIDPHRNHINGPGRLCKILGITKEHNLIDISKSNNFFIADTGITLPYNVTKRVGITRGVDKLWRFVADERNFDIDTLIKNTTNSI